MAISGFGRGKGGEATSSSSQVVSSSSSSSSSSGGGGGFGNLTAFIDQGSEFEGKLSFKDTVRIDGSFSGEISSDNTLIVGESGVIHATIKSVCVVISGEVEGDIQASDQVVLHKTALVTGDIAAPSLIMEEGAQLNGGVRMNGAAGRGSSATQSAPASSSSKPASSAKPEAASSEDSDKKSGA